MTQGAQDVEELLQVAEVGVVFQSCVGGNDVLLLRSFVRHRRGVGDDGPALGSLDVDGVTR